MLNILNVAQTGLHAAQVQVEGVMNNLANENTPGYKSRVVNVSELDHADSRLTGRGVSVDDISRITNVYMYQNLIEEESKLNSFTELDVMLNDIESIFYETDDSGLSADLNRYFQSLENLKTSPQNEIYRNDLKNNANILVDDLKSLYEGIEQREEATLNKATDTVEEINNILTNIGKISAEIVDTVGTPNDLLDKRDALEIELAKYVDIEISREDHYELKIGGVTAVRFDTNVHSINLSETYSPQKDAYAEEGVIPYVSNIVDAATWSGANTTAEEQTINITGTSVDTVNFLSTAIPGSIAGDTAEQTIDRIAADAAGGSPSTIIDNWNLLHPEAQIEKIEKVDASSIKITYLDTEGDVPSLIANSSRGIDFEASVESVEGIVDSVSYVLNNEVTITVNHGETISAPTGTVPTFEDIVVDETNIVRALVTKINDNTEMLGEVTAYNGQYELDKDGNKILTNNPLHSDYDIADPNKDRYLVIESALDGEKGKFVGEILVSDDDNVDDNGDIVSSFVSTHSTLSNIGIDDIHLEIYDEEISIKGGILNPMIENIKTESGENKFTEYKVMLDTFAKTLSDLSYAYIEPEKDEYVYGMDASSTNKDSDDIVTIGLFTGANVNSLTFHDGMANTLTQEKLDYLSSIQWKNDIDFKGTGEDKTSFSKFYQTIRVEIADNRETVIFQKESQSAVKEAMQSTYEKLTKVDKDKEMVDLIKFQAAYEANAKMITIVDEMLATLLGMKR